MSQDYQPRGQFDETNIEAHRTMLLAKVRHRVAEFVDRTNSGAYRTILLQKVRHRLAEEEKKGPLLNEDDVEAIIREEWEKMRGRASKDEKTQEEKGETSYWLWVRCPSCGEKVAKRQILQSGCWFCGWKGSQEELEARERARLPVFIGGKDSVSSGCMDILRGFGVKDGTKGKI